MPQVVPFISGFVAGLTGGALGGAVAVGAGASMLGAAAAGVAVGAFAAKMIVAAVISTVVSKAMAPDVPSLGQQLQTTLDPRPPKKIVYGETRIGGTYVYVNTTQTYQGNPPTYKKESDEERLLHLVIELAGHPIEEISGIYIDDLELPLAPVSSTSKKNLWPGANTTDTNGVTRYYIPTGDYTGYLMFKLYPTGSSVADADLVDAMSFVGTDTQKWTTNQKGIDKAYVYIRSLYNPELFQGFPKFTFQLKGKNDIYDPRTDSTGYSANTALVCADYMTTNRDAGGLGETWNQIETSSLETAANVCDEDLAYLYDGTTEHRYYIGGEISTGQTPSDILTDILSTMAGWTERINGKWDISAGVYTPPTVTITESELASRPRVTMNQSSKESFNSIRPSIRAPQNLWQPAPVSSMEYLIRRDFTDVIYSSSGSFFVTPHSLQNGDRVKFTNWTQTSVGFDNTKIPTGLQENSYYYVVSASTSPHGFKVSTTNSGEPLMLTDNGHTILTYWHDPYLTMDGVRRIQDTQYSLVNSVDLAKRLALIDLRSIRQEVTAEVTCKLGTPYACPFDIRVGDSIRWIDAHKDFWEYQSGSSLASGELIPREDGVLILETYVNDYLTTGDAVVFTDAAGHLTNTHPYYVSQSISPELYYISEYRGGPPVYAQTSSTDVVEFGLIQGKLFRVVAWSLDLSSTTPLVTLGLIETVSTLFDWNNQNEVEVEDNPGITFDSPLVVSNPSGFTATSGNSTLYIKVDGTVGSRAHLTWDEPSDNFVKQGGYIEIQYKRSPYLSWFNYAENQIRPGPNPTASYVFNASDYLPDTGQNWEHEITDDGEIRFVPSGANSLPTPLLESSSYFLKSDEPNKYYIKPVEYPASTDVVVLTDTGSGQNNWHAITVENAGFFYVDIEKDWVSHGNFPGISTQTYIENIKDGEFYDFRIRFRNAVGVESDWITVYNFYHSGKQALPNPVTHFSASYNDESLAVELTWIPPTDLDYSHLNIYRKLPFEESQNIIAFVQKGSSIYRDFALYPTSSDLTYEYQAQVFDTSNLESEIVSASTIVDGIDPIQNLSSSIDSDDFFRFNLYWENDSSVDWIAVQYFDYPEKRDLKTFWFKVEDSPQSFDVNYSGSYHIRAYRYRFIRPGSVGNGGGFSEPTDYISASIQGYGELLPVLTGSIETSNQVFQILWENSEDNHPVDYYEVYINTTNNSESATLLDTTKDSIYNYFSPSPAVQRLFWVKKVSVTGEKSDFSSPAMVGRCGWDTEKTKVADYSNILIYDPPVGVDGIGRRIDSSKTWTLNFEESQSFKYGPQKWEFTVFNNDAESVNVSFQSQILDNTLFRMPVDTTIWDTEGDEIPAGESKSFQFGPSNVVGDVTSPEKGYTGLVKISAYHSAWPWGPVNNVTCSLEECLLFGQIYDQQEGLY